tara:strand:+ start:1072 stop:1632 length:561 start_codon:yes stop_codon:yes gene_type:complete
MKNLIFIIIIITSISSSAQNNSNVWTTPSLLIRLSTNSHLINYYISQNNITQASIEEIKQKKDNQNIIQSFKSHYSESLIYFFYSDDSSDIKEGNLDKLFNPEGLQITKHEQEALKKENYMIGYFGLTEGNLNFHAFILNDRQLKPLTKPNIRFVRTYRTMGLFKRKNSKVISILAKKINFKKLRK